MSDGFDTGAHDFAADGTALVYRQLKVEALRSWLWTHQITAAEVRGLLDAGAHRTLNRVCRDVGVNPPSKGSPTWGMVIADLEKKEAWAAENPNDPRATRPADRPPYLPAGATR